MTPKPARVLLVDDEADFIEMLTLRLWEEGYEVLGVTSGKSCMEALEKYPADVILLDIKMPGMDGIETLREIRRRFPLAEVILLTGHGTAEMAVDGMRFGAFDYLLKPADFGELTAKIRDARERKEKQEERIRKAEIRFSLPPGGRP